MDKRDCKPKSAKPRRSMVGTEAGVNATLGAPDVYETRQEVDTNVLRIATCAQVSDPDVHQARSSVCSTGHTLKPLPQVPEYFTVLSIWMAEVLSDIGAGKRTVSRRRRTFVWREQCVKMFHCLMSADKECFHFGSQSEGTTTVGLESDIDLLVCDNDNNVNIMTVWSDWQAGMRNLLMLHDENTPPQQYLLQVISSVTREPETLLREETFVRKGSDQVLLSSERVKQTTEALSKYPGEAKKSGPSVSHLPNWDIVQAFPVCQPLPEIQQWIDRGRPGHWPSPQLLEAARVASCFLVPAGHPYSDYKWEEWRLSPNLIERMLMFSFNMTQIKCYIVLKMIKKSLFTFIGNNAITSFHCKSIMFFTIERTHSFVWKDNNLMFLVLSCLHTLRKWLRLGVFPHYIIAGVNLFDGKLSKRQRIRLLQYVDSMIKNNVHDIIYIEIDNFGSRLSASTVCGLERVVELGRLSRQKSIGLLLEYERFEWFLGIQSSLYHRNSGMYTEHGITRYLFTVYGFLQNSRLKPLALDFAKHLYALRASLRASKCIRLDIASFNDNLRCFRYSLSTDVASTYLKLASVLYCRGHLRSAAVVLEDVERRYHTNIKAVCACRRHEGDRDLQVFANMVSGHCDNGFSEPPFAFCVRFARQEAYCAPFILWFEMNRNMNEEEAAQRSIPAKEWMDCAEVDAGPFLHYLQYLTYGGLGERDKQLHAMRELNTYICDPRNGIKMCHVETALNLLGHCFEMEGDYQRALLCYEGSLRYYDTNNAANWHVRRVLRLISS